MTIDELINYVERKSDNLTAFSGDTIIRHLKTIKQNMNIELEDAFEAGRTADVSSGDLYYGFKYTNYEDYKSKNP